MLRLVACTYDLYGRAILDIFNDAIANTTALYDYKPRTMENMADWFMIKEAGRFPVIGAVDSGGRLLGFASYGTFRAWPANKYTVEHSVYVHRDDRGGGVGRSLLERLIAAAESQQYHLMIGGIDVDNAGSIALHLKLGFTHAGTITQVAFKFGRWLDLAFYQRVLPTPVAPVEG